eukprot:9896097-Karenia_brevis.AAC.1
MEHYHQGLRDAQSSSSWDNWGVIAGVLMCPKGQDGKPLLRGSSAAAVRSGVSTHTAANQSSMARSSLCADGKQVLCLLPARDACAGFAGVCRGMGYEHQDYSSLVVRATGEKELLSAHT